MADPSSEGDSARMQSPAERRRADKRARKQQLRAAEGQQKVEKKQEKMAAKKVRTEIRRERRRSRSLPDCEEVRRLFAARPSPVDVGDLSAYELRVLSQSGEDGVVHEVLRRAGCPTRRSVEIGCGANGGNSGLLAACFGYTALMIDGDPELVDIAANLFRERSVTVVEAWITRDNVNELVEAHGFACEVDYVGIDLDGMDYWIWDALTVCEPLLVVAEYNALFGPSIAVTVAYEATFERTKDLGLPSGYFGVSIAGLTRLAERRGYRLVATSTRTANAFFLKAGVNDELRALTPAEAWRPKLKGTGPRWYPQIQLEGAQRYFGDRGGTLVEIE